MNCLEPGMQFDVICQFLTVTQVFLYMLFPTYFITTLLPIFFTIGIGDFSLNSVQKIISHIKSIEASSYYRIL